MGISISIYQLSNENGQRGFFLPIFRCLEIGAIHKSSECIPHYPQCHTIHAIKHQP